MSWVNYEDACERGYDGPSPEEERRMRNRINRNNGLDPRDPDFDEELLEDDDETD